MTAKVVYVAGVLALIIVAVYVSGLQVYRYNNELTSEPAVYDRATGWWTAYLNESGRAVAEFNYTIGAPPVNASETPLLLFGFRVWHAPGVELGEQNMTFSIGFPAKVWVTGPNYDADGNAPLTVVNRNFTGGPGEVSGAVLTLSGFPSNENPTVLYGVGIRFQNGTSTALIPAGSMTAQLVLGGASTYPLVGEEYAGEVGSTLAWP